MQLHAMRTARQSGVWYGNSQSPAAATVLRSGARHLRLMSVLPRPDVRGTDVADLAYDMFAQARHALTDRGLAFSDVVCTWIYVRDIARNGAAFEQGRKRFYGERGLGRLPASTCVEGALVDVSTSLAMDLYAIAAHPDVDVSAVAPGRASPSPSRGVVVSTFPAPRARQRRQHSTDAAMSPCQAISKASSMVFSATCVPCSTRQA